MRAGLRDTRVNARHDRLPVVGGAAPHVCGGEAAGRRSRTERVLLPLREGVLDGVAARGPQQGAVGGGVSTKRSEEETTPHPASVSLMSSAARRGGSVTFHKLRSVWIYCSTLQCDLQGTDRRNW